jgi:(p)ppGpp synthase/HD superfamily hydrolase
LKGNKNIEKNYSSTIEVDLPHKPGALGNICHLIGLNKGNIINVELVERKHDYYKFSLDLQIKDLKNFTNLISQIKQSNLNFKIIRHKKKKNAFIRRIFENFKKN